MNKQIQRYYQTNVEEAVAEADYNTEQMKQALSEFGYTHFPTNGITDKGFRTLMERVSEIDEQEANLEPVKTKDLSSRVIEAPTKIVSTKMGIDYLRGKKRKSYLSVFGKDLGKIGGGLVTAGKAVGGFIGGMFVVPSQFTGSIDTWAFASGGVFGNILSLLVYYPIVFISGETKLGLISLGIHMGSNLIDGIYEYGRYVKKRAREETDPTWDGSSFSG